MSETTQNHGAVQNAFKIFLEANLTENRNVYRLRRAKSEETQLAIRYIKATLGDDADHLMAAYLTDPAGHLNDESIIEEQNTRQILGEFALHYIAAYPTDESAKQLISRLKMILGKSFQAGEIERPSYLSDSIEDFAEYFFEPKAGVCLDLLMHRHADKPGVQEFLLAIINGEFLRTREIEDYDEPVSNYERLFYVDGSHFEPFARHLFAQGLLNDELFSKLAERFPGAIVGSRLFEADQDDDQQAIEAMPPGFLEAYKALTDSLARKLCAELPAKAERFEEIFSYVDFSGLYWLEQGLSQIRDHEVSAKTLKSDDYFADVLHRLLGVVSLGPGETEQDALQMLESFDKKILKLALPYCRAGKSAVMQALGMSDLSSLDKLVMEFSGGEHGEDNVYNCASDTNGVIDLARLRQTIERFDIKEISGYLADMNKGRNAPKNTLMLVSAACGIDREKVEKKLVRHGQVAIKAWGLYPVVDQKELRDRYVRFKQMYKEASQYGPERQGNTRAAVAVGLKNLAQAAGFTDATRMEWALEADLAEHATALNEWQDTGDWQICLQIDGISPQIAVRKGDKMLKSVPPKVRQTDAYKAMRDSQDQIRGQASRFRATLQNMMCLGETIALDELATLKRLPIVATLLSRLILQTNTGTLGLFDPDSGRLKTINGELTAIDDTVRIAHPWHLYQGKSLPTWQKYVVEHQIVQPFKQAFRELYVVTPAEVNSVDTSRRFDGHVVDAAVASRLLQGRDWRLGGYEDGDVCAKSLSHFGIGASIEFADVGHYFAESSEVTMGEIQFFAGSERVKMEEVPPLAFSEVMRDADLVAAVAQVTESDERWSTEVAQRRSELVKAMIDVMGMSNVSCEGRFAKVQGQLARYRIHLGSGAIHIEPGNYLCIVPAGGKHEEGVFLPFADTDAKMREILSKVLLLSNDDKIKDQTILDQISESEASAA